MRHIPPAIVFLLPLAIAPGWFFYYDVTPKTAVLLAGLAALALGAAWKPDETLSFMTSRFGRWNTILAASAIAVLAISAQSSPYLSLAWNGSTWRRFGGAMQIATIAAAFLAAALASGSVRGMLSILRVLVAAGVLAGSYAILQYFGWDPWLDASAYHFGEGPYQIVRPPGTMGHSDYLAAFLLWPVFAAAGLYRAASSRRIRGLAVAAGAVAAIALLLCGSRGALLGLAGGGVVLAWLIRPRLRSIAAAAAAAALAFSLFYVSPAGDRLRARVFWIGEDSAGGARLLLWRDALHMSAERLWTGFGPDTFVAAFPQRQSAALSRAYPDFYHESPHNMFLDALLDEGLPGAALSLAWLALGWIAARRALRTGYRPIALGLLPALAGAALAHQFIVFTIPIAFLFFLTIGLLCAAANPAGGRLAERPWLPIAARVAATSAAVVALALVYRLTAADHSLVRVEALLDVPNPRAAADLWQSAPRHPGPAANLYFSRRFTQAAAGAPDTLSRLRYAQLAGNAAAQATQNPEQRQNAFYNLAILQAAANDTAAVEASLRGAIAAAPTWYKPHWTLALLLDRAGRPEEARRQALVALDLDGGHDPEVAASLREILRSATAGP